MDAKVRAKLTERERQRQLRVIREITASTPVRSQADVEKEIADIRESRRHDGRRHRWS